MIKYADIVASTRRLAVIGHWLLASSCITSMHTDRAYPRIDGLLTLFTDA